MRKGNHDTTPHMLLFIYIYIYIYDVFIGNDDVTMILEK